MSANVRQWALFGVLAVGSLVAGIATICVSCATVVPMAAASPDNPVTVTLGGWATLLTGILTAVGLGGASLQVLVHRLRDAIVSILPGAAKPAAEATFNVALIAIYAKLFRDAETEESKSSLRTAAKSEFDAEFDRLFPESEVAA